MASLLIHLTRRAGENFALLFKIRDDFDPSQPNKIRYGIRRPQNPIVLLSHLERDHWLALFVGFLAFYADFLDFNVLAAATKKIAAYYGTSKAHVSDSITYTMALRVIGAAIFGFLGDLIGRRWPLIIDLVILGSLQIASIYCTDINQFLGVRALFGIGMGGIWGCSASHLMENAPLEARGLIGGIFQASAASSGLTAAGLNMAFGAAPNTWKKMFWISCGLSYFAALVRFLVPESKQFLEAAKKKKELEALHGQRSGSKTKLVKFCKEFKKMFKLHWQTFIYSAAFVCLTSWAVHSYADNYVTFLISGKGINNRDASVITMISKSGCIIGMIVIGWLGEYVGRRRMAAVATLMAACLLPASILPNSKMGLAVAGWFYQFFFESYGAILAAHLNELSPVAFRAVMPGVAYQLGTSISAPSAMIVNDIAEGRHIIINGKRVEAYEPVIGITMAICYLFMILLAVFGPERRGADLEHFEPAGFKSESSTMIGSSGTNTDRELEAVNSSEKSA